eukprot:TRINITY_DN20868_c0_g1_i1.p1 TRINITY_DN20868_c0_g1~~TRINITY_DN20868_c0_g1_i1.p1  ORF type:complete len:339 (+),score=153.65 TRINITY_DN20868_c0_g1_i1:34-1050(+)
MSQFEKLGKANKDLLTKEFIDDKPDKQQRRRVEFNGKSSNGTKVSFSAFQKLSDESTEGSLKINRRMEKLDIDSEIEILPNNIKGKWTDSDRVKGLTVEATVEGNPADLGGLFAKKADAPAEGTPAEGDAEPAKAEVKAPKFGASLGVKYTKKVNDDFNVAGAIKASQEKKDGARLLEVSTAVHHSCGGSFGGLVKTPFNDLQKFKELAVAAQFAEGELTFNGQIKWERKDDALKSNLTAGVVHAYNAQTQWGAEAKLPLKGGKLEESELRAVLQRNIGAEQYKLRVAVPSGRIAGAFSTDFSKHSQLSVAAEGDLGKVVKGESADYLISSKLAFNAE